MILAFVAFVAFAIVVPGIQIHRRLGIAVDPALVLPAGFVFAAAAYALAAVSGLAWLFPIACAAVGLDLVLLRRPFGPSPGPRLRGAAVPIAAIVVLFALTEYRQNRRDTDGSFIVDRVDPEDQTFHVGLTFELSHSYPPQVPGLGGYALDYHLGWPLVRAAAVRWTGLTPYDLMNRWDLTLMAIALVLVVRSVTALLGGTSLAIALAPWTLVLCGYSWVWAAPQIEWWFTLFPGELLPHLFHANTVIPALTIGLGAVVCAHRAAEGKRGYEIFAFLLALATPFFKIFVAGQLLLAAAVAFVITRHHRALLTLLAPMTLSIAWLVLSEGGGARTMIGFERFEPIWQTRLKLMHYSGSAAAFAFAWILLSLGPRLLGVLALGRALAARTLGPTVLATFAAVGWPLSLFVQIRTAEPYPRPAANDALYFMDQSGPLLWVFAVIAVTAWRWRLARAAAAVAGGLGFVSTAQFVAHKRELEPNRIPPGIVRGIDALRAASRPGDVVLQTPAPKRYPPPALVLAPLRMPYTAYIPYLTQFAPRTSLDERRRQVHRFFVTASASEAGEIARALGARFVCLYGSERLMFPVDEVLRPVYAEENVHVYELKE